MSKSALIFVFVLLVVCFANVAHCQPFPPAPSAAAPLDGFSFLLIAGGAGIAAYSLRNQSSDNEDTKH